MDAFGLVVGAAFLAVFAFSLYAAYRGVGTLREFYGKAHLLITGVRCPGRIVGSLSSRKEVPADPENPSSGYSKTVTQPVYDYVAPSGVTHRGKAYYVGELIPWRVGKTITVVVDEADHNNVMIASLWCYLPMLRDAVFGSCLLVLPAILIAGYLYSLDD